MSNRSRLRTPDKPIYHAATGGTQSRMAIVAQGVATGCPWPRFHTVIIEGEAGIGKTRLAEELLDWVNRQGIPSAHTRSYAAEGALAYAPVIEWLRSPALHKAIAALDPVWQSELERLLPELITEFPDLPHPEPLNERWQRQRLFEALARAMTVDEHPKLLLIDDLQWCDQETLEWLRFLLHFAANAPLLVVGTVRSEEVTNDHPLSALIRELRGVGQLTTIPLAPLTANESAELATQVTDETLDEANAAHLFAASGGNALFVVEMARAGFWQADTLEDHLPFSHFRSDSAQSLPPKVYTIIQHRLAQLSPVARRLADLAAVIGRGFTYDELVAARDGDEETIVSGLDELWQRKLIGERDTNHYDFSHDRIREAAYVDLSPMRRKLFHQRVVRALEQVYAQDTDTVCGELAFHCEQAGLAKDAVIWYQRAGEVAWARHAFPDAANYQRVAIERLTELPISRETQEQELKLQVEYASSMTVIIGMAAAERRTALQRAEELAQTLQDVNEVAKVLSHLWSVYRSLGEPQGIRSCVDEAHRIIDRVTDQPIKVGLYKMLAGAAKHYGEFEQSLNMTVNVIQLQTTIAQSDTPTGEWPGGMKFNLAPVLWIAGFPEQAWEIVRANRVERDRTSGPFVRTNMMFQAAILLRNLGCDAMLKEEATQMSVLGAQYEMAMSQQGGDIFTGWLLAKRGELEKGIELTERGINAFRRTGHTMYQTHRLAMLVEMLLWAKRLPEAETVLQEALAISEHAEERFWDVELYRLQGDLLLAQGAPATQAEQSYLHAITIAQQQGSKSLELRATTALCHLLQRQGRSDEAYQALSQIYGWFTEGFDTHDLRATRELLTELASPAQTASFISATGEQPC
ncbi:MAG: AAA family ATPase [Caldilineaceae bacterium]